MSLATEIHSPSGQRQTGSSRRVLLVTQASGGGVGRHFLDLAAGLAQRGVDITGIYAPRKIDATFRQRLAEEALPPLYALPMRRAIHPLDAVDLWGLVRAIQRLGPFDLIHGHSSKGGALARLAARWLGIPSIYTPHAFVTLDPTLPAWKRRLYGSIERRLARHTAAIIAVSEDEAVHAHELGIESNKVRVVNNGIGRLPFQHRAPVRSQLGLADDDFAVGFVGRLAPQKDPELLVDAFALLFSRHPRARLVMVGSGPLETAVRQRAQRHGLANRVLMLGDVPAVPLMPALDVFCLSSRYEGLPYVLIEALAAGLPIVSTRVGGVTDCVEPHRNGLVVQTGSASALAGALSQLASDATLRQRFAAHSMTTAARFSHDRMVDETLLVYEHALSHSTSLQITRGQPTA